MEAIHTLRDLGEAKGLKLVHLNVRSLIRKVDQIRTLLADTSLDIVTFSETWLKQYISNQLVELDGYKSFRLDRATKGKGKGNKRGGGLITYIRDKYASNSELLDDLCVSGEHIEAQWLYIHRPQSKNLCVCNMYRPPNGDLAKAILYLEECLQTLNMAKTEVFLLGDMNVNYKNKSTPNFKKFNFFAKSNGLTQHISTTTRNTDKTKSLIDLALSNSKFIKSAGTVDHFVSDHQPIYILYKKSRDNRPTATFRGRSYKNFDKEKFCSKLTELDWDGFYDLTSPADAWNFLLGKLVSVLDEMCPIKTYHIKNYRPEWMTSNLLDLIRDRDYFYKKAKKSGDKDMWNIAKYLRNVANTSIRHAKRDFILRELEQNESNAKKFWKLIQAVVPTSKSGSKNDVMLKDGDKKVEKAEVATYINNYFINVGKLKPNQIPSAQVQLQQDKETVEANPTVCSMEKVSEHEVWRIIKTINTSKSSGLENISSHVIKVAFEHLKPEITFMFNLSISTATFPDTWKKALVVPIPKKGNLALVQNYRPISLLPLPGKIMEKLIHHHLANHFESGSLLAKEQHGFRKDHSTIHAIAQFTDHVSKKLDAKLTTLALFIDFRKAFDCVQHPILLEKLKNMNLDSSVTEWVKSYLTNRQQRVYANSYYSSYQNVTQGVPQGSVLGPLFYIVYANDLSKIVKNCKFALYADDTVLYISEKDIEVSIRKLQEDIDALSTWCAKNGIMANTDKTKVMLFGTKNNLSKIPIDELDLKFGGVSLQAVKTYTYLGMTLDNQLNYNLHVNKIIKSVTSKLNQFRKMRQFLTSKAAIMVYKGMMLPILEYGDIFMTGTSAANKKRLQILKNKSLRCAFNRDIDTSIIDLHSEANLLQLRFRREQHVLNFMFDMAQERSNRKSKSKSNIRTRSSDKILLKVRRPRTEKFRKSLAYSGPKKWNELSADLHKVTTRAKYKSMISDLVTQKAIRNTWPSDTLDYTQPL